MLHTVYKASQVLNHFSLTENAWGVREVARALQISKSTMGELMTSLAEQGLLIRTRSGRYRLGWRLFELGQVLLGTTEYYIEARCVMQNLVAQWGETTHLAVLDGAEAVCVENVHPPDALPIPLWRVGARLPVHSSGVGNALLAYQEEHGIRDVVGEKDLLAYTPNTITTQDRLAQALADVRRQGYAYDKEEMMLGLGCVAAPLRSADGLVIAAISFSMPAKRFYAQWEITPRSLRQRTSASRTTSVTGSDIRTTLRIRRCPPHRPQHQHQQCLPAYYRHGTRRRPISSHRSNGRVIRCPTGCRSRPLTYSHAHPSRISGQAG